MTDFPSLAEVQTTAWTPRSPPALGLIAIGVARDRLIGVIAWGFGPLPRPRHCAKHPARPKGKQPTSCPDLCKAIAPASPVAVAGA